MYLGDNLLRQGITEFVDAFEADRRAAAILTLEDGTTAAVGPDPADPGERPRALRRRGARRRRATSCSWSRSRSTRRRTWRSSACTCSTRRSTRRCRHRALGPRRARDHRRHPVADRPRPQGPPRGAGRVVEGHRQARAAARGQPAGPRDDRAAHRRDPSTPHRASRACRHQEGAEIVNSHIRGPAIIGERTGSSTATSALHLDLPRLRDPEHRPGALDHPRGVTDPRPAPDHRLAHRQAVEVARTDARPSAIRLMLGDHSRIEVE
jgi:hypothetical protein